MGGGSEFTKNQNSSKSFQNQWSKTTLGNTTTENPLFSSKTTNDGTTTILNSKALQDLYNSADNNINSLLNEYLNPNYNSQTNQAKLNAFKKSVSENTEKSLENDIIQPLTQRNMIRSSVANDMYNNLSKYNADSYADYINGLLSDTENNTANKLNNYMNWLLQFGNLMNGNAAQSLNTSIANGLKYGLGNTVQTSDSSGIRQTAYSPFGNGV